MINLIFHYWYVWIFLCFKLTRCIIFNIHWIFEYSAIDLFHYIKDQKWKLWNGFGINMFVGYFGSGKSLLASNFIVNSWNKYKNSDTPLTVYSNIQLSCDYIELRNFQQILDAPANTIIFIDECNTLFNARDWKNFPVELIYQLCQNRKKKIMLICTAPRFHLVDKSIRDVVDKVYACSHPFWRFHHVNVVDGWTLENCPNVNMIQRLTHKWYFVTNKFYKVYDTSAIIDNALKTEFLDKNEIVQNRQGAFYGDIVQDKTTRKYRKRIKQNNAS